MNTNALPPEVLFNQIAEYVAESRELLKSGAMLDIDGLEARTQELCTILIGLSQEERIAYADKLQTLLNDISKLGEEMVSLRDSMGDEIRSLTSVKKASVAYRVVDASDGYGKRKEEDEK